MKNPSWSEKFKERKIGQALAIYLGSAWVLIEAINFVVDKYRLNTTILDILILLVIFGLPAILIYAWFQQKFTRKAIILQAINGIIGLSIILFTLVNPGRLNPTQLRLLKFKDNQKKLAQKIGSIAILPFNNFTGDEDKAYLAAGMHDALICELGQMGAIRVVSRTSTLAYANSKKSIKEIASELNVDAIIEASLLGADESIRVQLKLVNAFPEEQQLWSQTYDTNMDNILNLYNNVLKNIADEIQLTLSPEQETKLAETREVNPAAYMAYLRGMYNLNQLIPEAQEKGIKYLHEAVKIAPDEPFAYAGLALGYLEIAHGFNDPGDSYTKAEEAVFKALKLDTTMAEIYTALGELYTYSFWKFDEGEKYYKRSLELNPSFNQTHYHYAWALYLYGRMEEAIVEHEIAQKGDPLNPLYTAMLGALYNYNGQYEDAIQKALKSLEIQKDYPFGYWVLGETYLAMGRDDEAIEAHKKLAEVAPFFSWALGNTFALTGHIDEAEKILKVLEESEVSNWNAVGLSVMYGALGRNDEAFKWIAYEPHHLWIPWVTVMPMWKPLHDDARYDDFVKRLNLPN